MHRQVLISFIVCLSSLTLTLASNDWNDFDARDIYPKYDTNGCVFPFNYQGKSYSNCTTDGDNGGRPWCALNDNYVGLFKYCYDFWSSDLKCVFPFTVNGKSYSSCAILSKRIPYKQCKSNNPNYPYRFCIEEHVSKSGKPLMRKDDCDSAYKSISPVHTKCAGPSDFAIPVALTADDKKSILDTHNSYRAEVGAATMFKLYWDDVLSDMAQVHSNMCAFDHDLSDNRITTAYPWKNGQNMVMTTELTSSLSDLLKAMFDSEKPRLVYGTGCTKPGTCTHYTQLMLSNLTRVGCGLTHCLFPDRVERYLTCNYIQAQYSHNYMTPYQKGSAASGCPDKKDASNLCDCGDKICKYDKDEYIDPNTCNCQGGSRKRSVIDKRSKDSEGLEELFGESTTYQPKPVTPDSSSGEEDKRSLKELVDKRRKRMVFKLGG